MVSSLLYISQRTDSCTQEEIDDILACAVANNAKLDITGMLLYSDSKFIQVLEGEGQAVTDLFYRIKMDKRHHDVHLLSISKIPQKVFPGWHMGFEHVNETRFKFSSKLLPGEEEQLMKIMSGDSENSKGLVTLIKKLFFGI
jgi:Sensors of blue-light using FAD